MNTFEEPRPIDFYEEQRIEIDNAEIDDTSTFDNLLKEMQALEGTVEKPAETEGEQVPPVPAPSPETASKEDGDSEKTKGLFQTALETVDFLASPLMAFGDASIAPIGHEYESEGFTGQLQEAAQVSAEAFKSRLFPTYGEEHENHGKQVVEKYLPNAPENVKGMVATSAELLTDPTVALALPFAKTIQKGLKIARETGEAQTFKGVFQEGLNEVLGVGKGIDTDELTQLGDLARQADAGDSLALKELNKRLDDSGAVRNAVQKADDLDVEEQINILNKTIGNPDAPALAVDKGTVPADVLKKSSISNESGRALSVNLARMNTSEDVDNLMLNIVDIYSKDFQEITRGMTNKEVRSLAQREMLQDLLGRKVTEFAPEQAYALRQYLVHSGNQLKVLAERANSVTATKLDELAFDKALSLHTTIQYKATGVATQAGRMLQSFNMVAKEGRGRLAEVNELITQGGIKSTHTKRVLKKLIEAADDPQALNRMVMKTKYDAGTDALFEIFTNSILSGPITHAVNMTSNAFLTSLSPTQSMMSSLSAAARFDFNESRKMFGESVAKLHGISQGIGDALRLATTKGNLKAIGAPEELARMHELAKQKMRPSITSENLGLQGKVGAAVDVIGNLIRIPGNMLVEEDKAFKLIHYRMETNAQAARKAMSIGPTKSRDVRSIYNALRGNPDEHMIAQSIDMASYYTFTQELGDIASPVHQALMKVPGVRYLLPFFKTPTNIVKMGVRHSVFGNAFKDLTPALSQMTPAGDVARAKIAMGTLIPATVMGMLDDNISGSVDMRTPAGRFKAEQGIPEYSIRIGDEWVSYAKIEPLKSILGMYVNYKEAIANVWQTDPVTGDPNPVAEDLFVAAVSPAIKTLGDNYMMPFFADIVYMLEGLASGNPEYAYKKLQRVAAAGTVPNLVRQVNSTYLDNTYRKADGYINMVKSGIPMLSSTLPAKYTVWGDERHVPEGLGVDILSPAKTASVKDDIVDNEMIRLEVRIPGDIETIPIPKLGVSLKLTPEQIAGASVLRGKGIDGQFPLKNVFAEFITSDEYAGIPDEMKKEKMEYIFNTSTENIKNYMLATDVDLQFQLQRKIQDKEKSMRESI